MYEVSQRIPVVYHHRERHGVLVCVHACIYAIATEYPSKQDTT